jgi:hypothetical protein
MLSGCSTVRLAYNSADFLIEGYADDYLGLGDEQLRGWSPTLDAALSRHRSGELPYLAAFFDSALADARQGFTRNGINCLLDQSEIIYQRHFRLASTAMAPLLVELNQTQVDELAQTFEREAKDDAAEAKTEDTRRRLRKRAERYVDNLRWWVGELDSEQRGIVRNLTRRIPDTAPAWYPYRDHKREQLLSLLRDGASETEVDSFLVAWLVDYSDMPSSLRQALPVLRETLVDLLLELQPTFSAEQQDKLLRRLEQLRNDFMALQKRPRMAPVDC